MARQHAPAARPVNRLRETACVRAGIQRVSSVGFWERCAPEQRLRVVKGSGPGSGTQATAQKRGGRPVGRRIGGDGPLEGRQMTVALVLAAEPAAGLCGQLTSLGVRRVDATEERRPGRRAADRRRRRARHRRADADLRRRPRRPTAGPGPAARCRADSGLRRGTPRLPGHARRPVGPARAGRGSGIPRVPAGWAEPGQRAPGGTGAPGCRGEIRRGQAGRGRRPGRRRARRGIFRRPDRPGRGPVGVRTGARAGRTDGHQPGSRARGRHLVLRADRDREGRSPR